LLLITGRDGQAVLPVAFCTALVDRGFMVARFDNHAGLSADLLDLLFRLLTFREKQITISADPQEAAHLPARRAEILPVTQTASITPLPVGCGLHHLLDRRLGRGPPGKDASAPASATTSTTIPHRIAAAG
jgi:hypothetical protein